MLVPVPVTVPVLVPMPARMCVCVCAYPRTVFVRAGGDPPLVVTHGLVSLVLMCATIAGVVAYYLASHLILQVSATCLGARTRPYLGHHASASVAFSGAESARIAARCFSLVCSDV